MPRSGFSPLVLNCQSDRVKQRQGLQRAKQRKLGLQGLVENSHMINVNHILDTCRTHIQLNIDRLLYMFYTFYMLSFRNFVRPPV